MTLTAVPASRTSKPASVREEHLVARLDAARFGARRDHDAGLGAGLGARRDDQSVPGLGLVVRGLDDDVVVQRLERHAWPLDDYVDVEPSDDGGPHPARTVQYIDAEAGSQTGIVIATGAEAGGVEPGES